MPPDPDPTNPVQHANPPFLEGIPGSLLPMGVKVAKNNYPCPHRGDRPLCIGLD